MKPVNKTVCSLAALAPLAMAQSANAGQRPNIIFFLVDDFGWTETSLPFGEETYPNNLRFHTPNMERLARTGVMMTNAYACPVSTPTRTSMMTGMNAAHMGITSYCSLYKDTCPDAIGGRPGTTNANEDDIFAHPEWNYNALCPASFRNEADSIAYGLNRTLYATPMVEILRDAGYHTIHVGKAHWAPTGTPGSNPYNMGFTVNIAGSGNGHPQSYLPEEHFGNLPKRGTYASVQNMSQYYGSGIHLTEALTLEALKTLEDPIRRKQPFYLYFAHYSNHTPIQRDERFIRKYLDAGMDEQQARYASMVEGMDKSLGDVLDYLEAKGIADDTIILFMSDNGGHCLGQDKGGEPHTQNLPLREGKASVYEGGIRVPLIFRWPGKAAEGTRLNTPVINEDIFPTILEMAGVKHYETVQECDGLSLVKLITAGSKMVAKAQKRHAEGGQRLRRPRVGVGHRSRTRTDLPLSASIPRGGSGRHRFHERRPQRRLETRLQDAHGRAGTLQSARRYRRTQRPRGKPPRTGRRTGEGAGRPAACLEGPDADGAYDGKARPDAR